MCAYHCAHTTARACARTSVPMGETAEGKKQKKKKIIAEHTSTNMKLVEEEEEKKKGSNRNQN